jgi:hypothetical protein
VPSREAAAAALGNTHAAGTMQHGYELALFTKAGDINHTLLCSACARVMKDPHACCEDGHGCDCCEGCDRGAPRKRASWPPARAGERARG